MTISIASELLRINKMQYLESMSDSDLAFWLVHSFTPDRFRAGEKDVIKFAVKLLYQRSYDKLIVAEFIQRLWGMHGMEPDHSPEIFEKNVVKMQR